jgi:hypothetical protein
MKPKVLMAMMAMTNSGPPHDMAALPLLLGS